MSPEYIKEEFYQIIIDAFHSRAVAELKPNKKIIQDCILRSFHEQDYAMYMVVQRNKGRRTNLNSPLYLARIEAQKIKRKMVYLCNKFIDDVYGSKVTVDRCRSHNIESFIKDVQLIETEIEFETKITEPTYKLNKPKEGCPICYDANVTIQTNCKHWFCRVCIAQHTVAYGKNACPCCRTELTEFYEKIRKKPTRQPYSVATPISVWNYNPCA